MQLTFNQLKNLPVYTSSGDLLGKIEEVEIDPRTHQVVKYQVKSQEIIKRLTTGNLLISPSQIISLTNEKMVVEDNVVGNARLVRESVAS
ncbi:MAG TPA: PRC-barrel domain-containing protein [Patescibacteria group bacterium]|nr:PRC-barrel domain-containing protein [Patescibacteria group bacterium]